MTERSKHHGLFASARARFLMPLLSNYLLNELKYFGPDLSTILASNIVKIFEAVCPPPEHIKPGQLVWNVLHRETRGDSKNRRFVSVVLTLINEDDVERLRRGESYVRIREGAMARMFFEAAEQGGVLSSRDAGLLFHISNSWASHVRIEYERKHDTILPHTGVLHDMGTTISHKSTIIRKVVIEKKDPTLVAKETNHTQRGVDRYLKDYHRIYTIYKIQPDISFICQVTGLSKSLVKEYIKLIEEHAHENKE